MKSIKNRIESSKQYLGKGTYRALMPILTEKALKLGFHCGHDGVIRFDSRILGEDLDLDRMESEGLISLQWGEYTAV